MPSDCLKCITNRPPRAARADYPNSPIAAARDERSSDACHLHVCNTAFNWGDVRVHIIQNLFVGGSQGPLCDPFVL